MQAEAWAGDGRSWCVWCIHGVYMPPIPFHAPPWCIHGVYMPVMAYACGVDVVHGRYMHVYHRCACDVVHGRYTAWPTDVVHGRYRYNGRVAAPHMTRAGTPSPRQKSDGSEQQAPPCSSMPCPSHAHRCPSHTIPCPPMPCRV